MSIINLHITDTSTQTADESTANIEYIENIAEDEDATMQ